MKTEIKRTSPILTIWYGWDNDPDFMAENNGMPGLYMIDDEFLKGVRNSERIDLDKAISIPLYVGGSTIELEKVVGTAYEIKRMIFERETSIPSGNNGS